jgi:hypothetical protein
MPWQTIPGLCGKVYIPESVQTVKKHLCADCFACQSCGEQRCRVCQAEKGGGRCACSSDGVETDLNNGLKCIADGEV